MTRRPLVFLLFLVLPALAGCGSFPAEDEIEAWRTNQPHSGATDPGSPDRAEGLAEVDALRRTRDTARARELALGLAARFPEDPDSLWRAARAEADMVFVLKAADAEVEDRNLAAASGLRYAERALELSGSDPLPEVLAQAAYARGTTVHLEPMLSRTEPANQTWELANRALELDPDQATALAVLSILHVRLETLPWIATAFAGSLPETSLEEGVAKARRCVELAPGIEHHLLLARALVANEQQVEALEVLEQALLHTEYFPRDKELRQEASDLRDELQEELAE